MILVDTHTHLYDSAFKTDFSEAVSRAINAGVTHLVFPDIDSKERTQMMDCAALFPNNIHICAGLHPENITADNYKAETDALYKHLDLCCMFEITVCAIGETGLDYHWDRSYIDLQKESFIRQARLAREKNLTLIVHERDAFEDTLECLKQVPGVRAVFHAYSHTAETWKQICKLDGDFYMGIGGVCTYKNSHIGQALKDLPLDRIVLETDSPYLTPVPHRGKRNESSYIPFIAEKIAQAKDISLEEVAKATTSTAMRIFKLVNK